ncbi:MAG TPA: glycogen debranching N-terminal domain-containing protein [Methylomirabilota bacterium]|nr:glycogen debranching N-terminal domain-containing protein [Methylomirabilota bacterium]
MTIDTPRDDLLVGDRYYILASSVAADLPKIVLKHDDAFLVADRRGNIPFLPGSEFGFYVDDTRFLRRLELRLGHQQSLLLSAGVSEETLEGVIELTNPDLLEDGRVVLPRHTLRLSRTLTLYGQQLSQRLMLESFAPEPVQLLMVWEFGADFADVFEVRGFRRARRGVELSPDCQRDTVELPYRGVDGVIRTTRLTFDPPPARLGEESAEYLLELPASARLDITVTVTARTEAIPRPVLSPTHASERRRQAIGEFRRQTVALQADHELFNRWIERSWGDLRLLVTDTADGMMPYAGIPWYVAPFGRDSLFVALQTLPFLPAVARGTLRYLAHYQARTDDAFTDQEPGKILHEYRRGELAACREIPFVPYYGTVDATPLFLILLGEYVRWTADLDLARELWPAAERALAWLERSGAPSDDGYLWYRRRSPVGLDNQGWKDSHDSIMHATGELAKGPIALVEAQAYRYAALLAVADVAESIGRGALAPGLRTRAGRLRERFENDFWMEDQRFYALALDGEHRPCRVLSSNPGHALWAGIASETRARAVAEQLMAPHMLTGWGVRTLSSRERLYNPMSYHNGSVWPHDTAIAALGMRRYGLQEPLLALATGLFQAVLNFDGLRMPELFCGFAQRPGQGPIRYPVACSPQAWSAGVVFHLVAGMLGLTPQARENRLMLDRPCLPTWLRWIEVGGIQLAASRVSLRVSQGRDGAAVELVGREGDVELIVRR